MERKFVLFNTVYSESELIEFLYKEGAINNLDCTVESVIDYVKLMDNIEIKEVFPK